MHEQALTKANWKDAVQRAIRELPADIREMFVSSPNTNGGGDSLLITCGANPETEWELSLTYWNTGHEQRQHEQAHRKPGDYVNPYEEELLDAHGGHFRKMLDSPVIAFDTPTVSTGVYVGRISIADFTQMVQLDICDGLFETGVIGKDEDGLFIRENGSQLLPWQEPDDLTDEDEEGDDESV